MTRRSTDTDGAAEGPVAGLTSGATHPALASANMGSDTRTSARNTPIRESSHSRMGLTKRFVEMRKTAEGGDGA